MASFRIDLLILWRSTRYTDMSSRDSSFRKKIHVIFSPVYHCSENIAMYFASSLRSIPFDDLLVPTTRHALNLHNSIRQKKTPALFQLF